MKDKSNKELIYYSNNHSDTEKLGKEFAQKLSSGDVVFLYGELGAGKTTFVKGVAQGLGIASRIISPTFVILRQHMTENNKKGIQYLYHVDLYRLIEEKEITGIDLKDITEQDMGVTFIEWPEIADSSILPSWKLSFHSMTEDKREILIQQN